MSEQDFFFDEEPESKAPAAKSAKAPAKTPSKAAAKTPATASTDASATVDSKTTADPAALSTDTLYSIGALIGVLGILLGAILGFLLGNALAPGSSASTSTLPAPTVGSQSAPTLTEEQLTTSTLPPGHPSVGTSAPVTPAP